MIMRHCLKALGEDTICVIPASCWSIIAGNWPYSSWGSLSEAASTTMQRADSRSGRRSAVSVAG